jgi:hypothetical protein
MYVMAIAAQQTRTTTVAGDHHGIAAVAIVSSVIHQNVAFTISSDHDEYNRSINTVLLSTLMQLTTVSTLAGIYDISIVL